MDVGRIELPCNECLALSAELDQLQATTDRLRARVKELEFTLMEIAGSRDWPSSSMARAALVPPGEKESGK